MEQPESFLACPLCGCSSTPVELGNQYEENFKLQCVDCKATTGRYRTRYDATKAWNVRAGANGPLNDNRSKRLAPASWLDALDAALCALIDLRRVCQHQEDPFLMIDVDRTANLLRQRISDTEGASSGGFSYEQKDQKDMTKTKNKTQGKTSLAASRGSAAGSIREDPPFDQELKQLLWGSSNGTAHIIIGGNGQCMCGMTENGEAVGCRDIIYNAILREFRDFLRKPPPNEKLSRAATKRNNDMEQPKNVLACPFCDCERWGLAELDPGYQIICMNCFARGPEKLVKDEAYDAWNAPAGTGRALRDNGGKQLCSSAWLEELREIVASGLRLHDEVGAGEQPSEIKVLLELPLTDPEYQRLRQIVSSSNGGEERQIPAHE